MNPIAPLPERFRNDRNRSGGDVRLICVSGIAVAVRGAL